MVRVYVLPPLPRMLGLGEMNGTWTLEVELEPKASLYDLFHQLAAQQPVFDAWVNPRPGDMLQSILVSVDGRLVYQADFGSTLLQDGAEVRVFPPYSGG